MSKILVIEDDLDLSEMIGRWLEKERHIVELIDDGLEGLSRIRHYTYELIILDWNLPNMEGIDILKQMRAEKINTSVLMLTGMGTIDSRLEGLNSGADDYLTKPFHARELMARVEAILRRPQNYAGSTIKLHSIELDSDAFKVTRSGEEIKLQPKEFALLEYLMRNRGKLFTAEALLEQVWGNDSAAGREAITTCIKRLRKKLDVEGEPSIIRNVHGAGYGVEG